MFSDLVGFTELAKCLGAEKTVALLDQVVTEFDLLASAHGVEKIKTTGDGYKDAVMERAVRCKFTQHEELPRLLLSTGDQNLAEAGPTTTAGALAKKAWVRTGSGFCLYAFAQSSAGRPSR
jgi:class 3 adenylate cyclase